MTSIIQFDHKALVAQERVQDMLRCVPDHMHQGLQEYIFDGCIPGDFLMAILCNDFPEAVLLADDMNKRMFSGWAYMVHNLPKRSWGSLEKVEKWSDAGGINGMRESLVKHSMSQTDA